MSKTNETKLLENTINEVANLMARKEFYQAQYTYVSEKMQDMYDELIEGIDKEIKAKLDNSTKKGE